MVFLSLVPKMTLKEEQQNIQTTKWGTNFFFCFFLFWIFMRCKKSPTRKKTAKKSNNNPWEEKKSLLNFSQMGNFYFFNPLYKRRVAIRYNFFFLLDDNHYDKEGGMRERKKPQTDFDTHFFYFAHSASHHITKRKPKLMQCNVNLVQWIDKVIELACIGLQKKKMEIIQLFCMSWVHWAVAREFVTFQAIRAFFPVFSSFFVGHKSKHDSYSRNT